MKNIKITFLCYMLLFSIQDISASTGLDTVAKTVLIEKMPSDTKTEAQHLRRAEIKQMDKSALSTSQKKLLRKEDQAIKKEQVHGGGGIYFSLSAIVVVLLLLIILL